MAAKKGKRPQARAKQASHARRRAAEMARRKRIRKRNQSIAAVVAVIAAVGVLAVLVVSAGGGSNETDVAAGSSTTAPMASAAGKPCVPVADPLPPGAPAVPVKVGAPPEKLIAEDLKPGTGPVVAAGQTLSVNYIGVACSTGKIFDSSYETGKPASLPLSGVIPGWQEGIPGMMVGGQRLLGIPPDKAYGKEGRPPDIAPDETLWFVVEVLEAKAAA